MGASGKRGVAIYVKDDLNCTEIHLETVHEDHVRIEINLHKGDKLLCGYIYRSPNNLKQETIKTTSNICDVISEAVQRNSSHLLICGDFNYPKIDWTHEYAADNFDIAPFLNTIQNSYLTQHVLQPTRYRGRDESSLIDLVFTNENGMINEIIHDAPLGDSDHECLMFSFQCYKDILKMLEMPNYFKANYHKIRERLKQIVWQTVLQDGFTNAYCNFTQTLTTATDGCILLRKRNKKNNNFYITAEATRKEEGENKLWRRHKSSSCTYDRSRYTKAKNKLRSFTRKLRRDVEKDIAHNIKSTPKRFWSYVKYKTKSRIKIPSLKKPDGTEATTPNEKAEALNQFFSSTFTDEKLENIPESVHNMYSGDHLNSFVITPQMVLKRIMGLHHEKSPGPDGWHPVFLINVADLINVPLARLFQKSLIDGVVPPQWLVASVTAIHKKEQKTSQKTTDQ